MNDLNWCHVAEQLPERAVAETWLVDSGSGAQVTFTGTVRDHAEGHTGVTAITYEAYVTEAVRRLAAICDQARGAWPELGRVVLWHRTGTVRLGEASVVVATAAAHRDLAFTAARFCIDVLKQTLPVWKLEHGETGPGWSRCGVPALGVQDASDAWWREQGRVAR